MNMLVAGASPTSVSSTRGKSTAETSMVVSRPGRISKRYAPVTLGLSSRACTVTVELRGVGSSIQNARNHGNSSPAGSPTLRARPRADKP
jgi:hypothetical protein